MPIVDAYGERKLEEILRDTWGHLDAKPGVKYPGTIVFAEGAFGSELIILSSEFGDAGYGPWFYEGVSDWLRAQDYTDPGKLYQFKGWYRLSRKGAHTFSGAVAVIDLPEDF